MLKRMKYHYSDIPVASHTWICIMVYITFNRNPKDRYNCHHMALKTQMHVRKYVRLTEACIICIKQQFNVNIMSLSTKLCFLSPVYVENDAYL